MICHHKVTQISLHVGEWDGVVVDVGVVVVLVDDGHGGSGHGGDFHHVHIIAVDAVCDGGVAEDVHGELLDIKLQSSGYSAEP